MKDLFDPTLAEDIKQRIMRLHPELRPRSGAASAFKSSMINVFREGQGRTKTLSRRIIPTRPSVITTQD